MPVDIYAKGAQPVASSNPALTAALEEAYKKYQDGTKTRQLRRDEGYGQAVTKPTPQQEYAWVQEAFTKAGLDPKLVPKNVDLGMYKTLSGYNGVGKDPLAVIKESTYYDDGRSKDEANTRDFIAKGLANGLSSAEIQKNIEAFNDSQRGKNSGLNLISGGVSHLGKVIAENPIAQTAISIAASSFGVPPNVTMALLSANNIGQGQDPMTVARNVALQYAGGKLGDMAGGAAKTALGDAGLSKNVTSGLTGAAKGAASGALQSAASGQNILQGALKGGVGGLSSAAAGATANATDSRLLGDLAGIGTNAVLTGKGINANSLANAGLNALGRTETFKGVSDSVSSAFKDAGLDGINIGGVNIPGGVNLKDNIVPGLNARDATTLLSQANPMAGRIVNTLQRPTLSGIAALTQAPPARRPPPRPTQAPPPAVLAAFNKTNTLRKA